MKRSFLRYLCSAVTEKPDLKKTVFLPKTDFPTRVKSTERSRLDSDLFSAAGFARLYEWQQNAPDRQLLPEFVLLDGPPYANGLLHVGHAVNKIMKDFVVKSKIASGHRVRFQPGWDCHGLPIELAVRKSVEQQDPIYIRQKCVNYAQGCVDEQANLFKRWVVTADWKNPYVTMSRDYIRNQLNLFADLYASGVIYRAFKPVYWSPSSQSALAESELEYNDQHKSLSAFFRFRVINSDASDFGVTPELLGNNKPTKLYALIWTTTPWTLPMNNAIMYNENLKYCIVFLPNTKGAPYSDLYIVCADIVESLEKLLEQPVKILTVFDSKRLDGLFYRSVHQNGLALPFLQSESVTNKQGTTGLVHTSFTHGFDDYKVALANGFNLECFVDENGNYERILGPQLYGKSVLNEGNKLVLEMYKKHVVHTFDYTHSYPYDWRTKKPVIIRSSMQWFVDLSKVGQLCIERLKRDNVKVQSGSNDQLTSLISQMQKRPDWCISRQRTWGVPIPAVLNKSTNMVVTSAEFIKSTAYLFEKVGCDSWWQKDVNYFLNKDLKSTLNLDDNSELEKATDIMDVWMDSGVAWSTLNGNQIADLVIEGQDQFRGWFQSLLLTSMLVRNECPFKQVLVHGFTVDDKGHKMSKSAGNVIDPGTITDGNLSQSALGVDGLRLWVAMYGCENAADIRLGPSTIEDLEKRIHKFRNSFRFILGTLHGYEGQRPSSLPLLDQFIISRFEKLSKRVLEYYDEFRFRAAINEIIKFSQNPMSSIYMNLIKDRLYCDRVGSDNHIQAQFTLNVLGVGLAQILAPILPHLTAEFLMHHPILKSKFPNAMEFLLCPPSIPNDLIVDEHVDEEMHLLQKLRLSLDEKSTKSIDYPKTAVMVEYDSQNEKLIKKLQPEDESVCSQLVELLGVSSVKLQLGEKLDINMVKRDYEYCVRCRKYNRKSDDSLCARCSNAI